MTQPHTARGSPVIALDLARGLAALTVLAYHVRGSNWVELSVPPAAHRNLPTEVFFAQPVRRRNGHGVLRPERLMGHGAVKIPASGKWSTPRSG